MLTANEFGRMWKQSILSYTPAFFGGTQGNHKIPLTRQPVARQRFEFGTS